MEAFGFDLPAELKKHGGKIPTPDFDLKELVSNEHLRRINRELSGAFFNIFRERLDKENFRIRGYFAKDMREVIKSNCGTYITNYNRELKKLDEKNEAHQTDITTIKQRIETTNSVYMFVSHVLKRAEEIWRKTNDHDERSIELQKLEAEVLTDSARLNTAFAILSIIIGILLISAAILLIITTPNVVSGLLTSWGTAQIACAGGLTALAVVTPPISIGFFRTAKPKQAIAKELQDEIDNLPSLPNRHLKASSGDEL